MKTKHQHKDEHGRPKGKFHDIDIIHKSSSIKVGHNRACPRHLFKYLQEDLNKD